MLDKISVGWIFAVEHEDGDILYAIRCCDIIEAEEILRQQLTLGEEIEVSPVRELSRNDAEGMGILANGIKGPF